MKDLIIIKVRDKTEGNKAAFDLLKKTVSEESAVFLSGGSSPKGLYQLISRDKSCSIRPLSFCTVDERWGPPGHKNSNELMIEQTGLYNYASRIGVEVHKILRGILNRQETAERYNVILEGIFARASKSVAIMGIGIDGHTAGIAPGVKLDQEKLVLDYSYLAPDWQYPERITLTLRALQTIDEYIILAFGESKLPALWKLVKGENKIYSKLHKAIYLITDQRSLKVSPFIS